MKTRWILSHGLQLKVKAVIDMNKGPDQNDQIVHVLLSNIDTDGPNTNQNKERLANLIAKRT